MDRYVRMTQVQVFCIFRCLFFSFFCVFPRVARVVFFALDVCIGCHIIFLLHSVSSPTQARDVRGGRHGDEGHGPGEALALGHPGR